jgi:hypothetical protein
MRGMSEVAKPLRTGVFLLASTTNIFSHGGRGPVYKPAASRIEQQTKNANNVEEDE